jgi:hypothetical protein
MKYSHKFRETREFSKGYIENVCQQFALDYAMKFEQTRGIKIGSVDFGKQDMRGAPSVTLFDTRHCVPHQRHFASNKEMFAFMQGFIQAGSDYV